jgi:hypothetical protein
MQKNLNRAAAPQIAATKMLWFEITRTEDAKGIYKKNLKM